MNDVVNISSNAVVLKNRGFRLKVHTLKEIVGTGVTAKYERSYDPEGNPVTEDLWFKFTNASLAEIELDEPCGFGSIEAWGEAMEEKPFMTLAKTFAIVAERYTIDSEGRTVPDWRYGGNMVLDGELPTYLSVMMGALQIAQGSDPNSVRKSVLKAIEEAQEELQKALETEESGDDESDTPTSQTHDSPSQPGSADGQS